MHITLDHPRRLAPSRRRPLADRLVTRAAELGLPNPGVSLLAPCRRTALDETLARYAPRTEPLASALALGDAAAKQCFARIADEALAHMRRRSWALASERGPVHAALAQADRLWLSTAPEHIDNPELDPALRQRAMKNLDRVNDMIGSYAAFFELLRPAWAACAGRPLRVLELAAGHGGFALALARMARARGLAIEITVTDIKAEYLELARGRAALAGLPLNFEVRDALELGDLEPGDFDLVLCTQALHHFEPGSVAVMLAEAARVAGQGVIFIDGARSLTHAPVLYAYLRAQLSDPILAHDAWVSCRRFFMAEELALLARLGPGGGHATARWMAPNHSVLELSTPAIRS